MQKRNITMLDCTLRDGAYITGSMFGDAAIRGIINKIEDAGIEIIECGWLKNDEHKEGSTFFHVPADLEPYITNKDPHKVYVVMIDWDRYDLQYLPQNDGKTIDAIRIVFPHGRYKEGVAIGQEIIKKGYKVYLQAAHTMSYSNEELEDMAKEVNGLKPEALSIVDTFGAMYPEDLERIVEVLHQHLDKEIGIGWHSHNNQQLSFALSMNFASMMNKLGRNGVIDASLCGMGRGAGNTTTELAAAFLNRKYQAHYNLDAVMDVIDTYISSYQEKYEWGYSTPYFIAGMYCCHVNNIAYLLNNHRTGAKDMRNIIESLPAQDRIKYDYDLLEEKYVKNESFYVDDTEALETLRKEMQGRELLLIAPGKSSIDEQDRISSLIREKKPIVIGVNAIMPGYEYDYLFFVNSARYDYAEMSNAEVFTNTKRIVLSNVKNTADGSEVIIAFERAVKRGWKFFDNAVICALRLLEQIQPSKVLLSGFDGFKMTYNESYADPMLPSLNSGNDWNDINAEIQNMFTDFKNNATIGDKVCFVTESLFEQNEQGE